MVTDFNGNMYWLYSLVSPSIEDNIALPSATDRETTSSGFTHPSCSHPPLSLPAHPPITMPQMSAAASKPSPSRASLSPHTVKTKQ